MNCTTKFNNETKSNTTCCFISAASSNSTKNNCTTHAQPINWGEWPPQPYNDFYVTLMCLVTGLVILGNFFILCKLKPFTRRQHLSNVQLLIVYLSVFDLAAILFLIADIYENLEGFDKWPFGWFGCKLMYPSFNISLNMSVCILIIMSVDRCRSIRTPLKKKFSKRSIHAMVFAAFVLSAASNWYQFGGHALSNGVCMVARTDPGYLKAKTAVTCARDIIFMIVFTITTYLISHSLKHNDLLDAYPSRKSEVIRMLITMETVFAILIVPYDLYDIAMMVSRLPGNTPIEFTNGIWHCDRLLAILQMSNSFANCFIYAKMHKYIPKTRRNTSSTSTIIESRKGSRQNSQQELAGTGNQGYSTTVFM